MASTNTVTADGEAPPAHKHPYHLVDPSPWPLVGSFSAGALVLGIILNSHYGDRITFFVGLAGVYDVEKHYLFEATRGLHEVSPMGAAAVCLRAVGAPAAAV